MQPARRRRVETGVPAAGDRIYGTGYGIGTLSNHTGCSWGRRAALADRSSAYAEDGMEGVKAHRDVLCFVCRARSSPL